MIECGTDSHVEKVYATDISIVGPAESEDKQAAQSNPRDKVTNATLTNKSESEGLSKEPEQLWGRGRVTLLGDAAHATIPNGKLWQQLGVTDIEQVQKEQRIEI